MASAVPTIRQIAWISIIPQMIIMGMIISVYYYFEMDDPFVYGALTFIILYFMLRNLLANDHRQGMNLVKQQLYADAIPFFEKSVEFFTKHSWVDKYRFLTLLSSSRMTYKEMGLCNIAFCYSQINEGQKAKEYYERTINDFPENIMAKAGLNMINSVQEAAQTGSKTKEP